MSKPAEGGASPRAALQGEDIAGEWLLRITDSGNDMFIGHIAASLDFHSELSDSGQRDGDAACSCDAACPEVTPLYKTQVTEEVTCTPYDASDVAAACSGSGSSATVLGYRRRTVACVEAGSGAQSPVACAWNHPKECLATSWLRELAPSMSSGCIPFTVLTAVLTFRIALPIFPQPPRP